MSTYVRRGTRSRVKRKRTNGKRRGTRTAITKRQRGYVRTSGFYGRYGPNQELKFHDVDLDDAVISTTGEVTPTINIIVQGTAEEERIGRKCTIKNIMWRYTLVIPEIDAQATPNPSVTARVILFLDKQANGATAAVLDVLESTDYQSFHNLGNSQRFTTLLDRTHTLNYSGMASDGAGLVSQAEVRREYSFYKACSIPIEFSSTTGVISEIRSNNIGVLLIANGGNIAFFSKFRLRFTDGG